MTPPPQRFWFFIALASLIALLLILISALPVRAHTNEELTVWLDDWESRYLSALIVEHRSGFYLDITTLSLKHQDWQDRHPCRKVIDTWTPSCDTPAPTTLSHYRGMGSNVEQWRPLVTAYFGSLADTMLCLISYESGGNEHARNPSSSATGLTQILYSSWGPHFGLSSRSDLEDPDTNIRLAWQIYLIQGWWAWAPYHRGRCH